MSSALIRRSLTRFPSDVWVWHIASILACLLLRRSWGQSGHGHLMSTRPSRAIDLDQCDRIAIGFAYKGKKPTRKDRGVSS